MVLNIKESYESNKDYIEDLLRKVDDSDNINDDLLSQIVSVDMYLRVLISNTNNVVPDEILELSLKIRGILKFIDSDKVAKIRESVDFTKLLTNKTVFSDSVYDKSYYEGDNIVEFYIKNRIFALANIFLCLCIMLLCNVNVFGALPLINIDAISKFDSLFGLVRLLCLFGIMILMFRYILDLMYICLPALREMFEHYYGNLLGVNIKEVNNRVVTYTIVDGFNRIERCKVLLSTMLYVLNIGLISDLDLQVSLERIDKELDRNKHSYWFLMSEIEQLHDKYLELLQDKYVCNYYE